MKKKEAELQKLEEQLKDYLRATGRMFPETPAQVDAFESRNRKKVKIPALLADPLAIIHGDYILPQADNIKPLSSSTPQRNMAARTARNISAETFQKINEDWIKAENQE